MLPLPSELAPLIATVVEIIALGALVIAVAVILGHFLESIVGEFLLVVFFPLIVICLTGYMLFGLAGFALVSDPDLATRAAKAEGWATVGLVMSVIFATGLSVLLGRDMGTSEPGKRRGAIFFPGLWVGFCLASWIGHTSGGWVGLLVITLPAMVIFWLAAYHFARFTLPLDENQPVSRAFRCLVTFSAGTNYPYYVLEDREKVERVPGNQFKRSFSGPGIFLTGPDHVVAVSDGLKFKDVRGPGVVFTYWLESIQEPMDLRPQQRAYTVEATTRDGIRVRFTTFGPFQLDAGEQQPEPGKPFPFRASSVFKAFHAQPMDIKRDRREGEVVEERKRRRWDELYEMIGTHVMQDIIAQYEFNELCEPFDPEKDPRVEIARKYRKRIRRELSRHGIKIPGGSVSNLLPADRDVVFKQRIRNWQVRWRRKMLERLGVAEAEAERLVGQTRAQVQADMIQNISEAIAEVTTDDEEVIINTVALRFIESLNQMVAQPRLRDHLPPDVVGTVGDLPRIIGGE